MVWKPKTKIKERKLANWDVVKVKYKLNLDWKILTWRPAKKTPELLKNLQEALMKGCTEQEACAYAWISQVSLIKRKKEDANLVNTIAHWKSLYAQHIKFASFDRAMDTDNKDSTDILFKIDKRYSDKQDIDVKGEISLVWLAKAMQQKRLDSENSEEK